MNPLRLLKDVLLALHGGTESRHLAAGFALGAALGLVPKGNLFAAAFFLLFFLFNVDKSMAFISAGVFTGVGYAIDPLAHKIGWVLLRAGALHGLWTALYDLPIVPLTRFNNTVVLGNFVLGLALYAPLYYGFLKALKLYDKHLRARVEKLPLIKALKGWGWYQKYERWLA
ncbi:MAG: TIGR03546 family protein [Elusimicrobia bacterium]|nr:TIGR03546 family protein [Elusimicrobiota bacterium]